MMGGTTFTFVTDGIASVLDRARAAAGSGNVAIAGGAATINRYLAAGLIDELRLHVVPFTAGVSGGRASSTACRPSSWRSSPPATLRTSRTSPTGERDWARPPLKSACAAPALGNELHEGVDVHPAVDPPLASEEDTGAEVRRGDVQYRRVMPLDLFAGIAVRDLERAKAWYERLLGSGPSWEDETEAVWELAEHRSIVIEQAAEHAGHALHTVFVDDFDGLVTSVAARGIEPAKRETYDNGVRKALYRDPDGNEISFGGAPR